MSKLTSRRAFTLVELLVAMVIVAVAIGLVLGAVQKARAAGARVDCANNLHQVSVAAAHYLAVHNVLPAGQSLAPDSDGLSWHVALLPYLEQEPLAVKIRAARMSSGLFTNEAHKYKAEVLKVYICPADPTAAGPVHPFSGGSIGLTSYLGVEGTNFFKHDGCLFQASKVSQADITDGASQTLLIGERPASAGPSIISAWYTGVWSQWAGTGSCATLLGVREVKVAPPRGCPIEPGQFEPGQVGNRCDLYNFWSLHPGGGHFVLADGSVRFFTYAANEVLPALATRAGGEVVVVPD